MRPFWRVLLSLVAILTMGWTASPSAQRVGTPRGGSTGSWRLIGTTQASHSADHDLIAVRGPYDYFRKLKFKVTNAPLKMQRMLVTYDDKGAPERIDVRQNIAQGGESRLIDLRGGKRKIRTIEFWYDTKGFLSGKADVTVFGMK